jgi:hypothetical protein
LDDTLQLGWNCVHQVADAGDAAASEKYQETGCGFLFDAPPKTSVRRGFGHGSQRIYLYLIRRWGVFRVAPGF